MSKILVGSILIALGIVFGIILLFIIPSIIPLAYGCDKEIQDPCIIQGKTLSCSCEVNSCDSNFLVGVTAFVCLLGGVICAWTGVCLGGKLILEELGFI